jgi:hypothetical protein
MQAPLGHRRACVPWSRSSPRASCWRARARLTALHTAALIATFRRAGPARCGAFADERGVEGDCAPDAKTASKPIAPSRTAVPIATFRCAAPARCGAFADERGVVARRRRRTGASSTRVRLPGRVVRRRRCGVGRWHASYHHPAHRHLPSRYAHALRPDEGVRETLIRPDRARVGAAPCPHAGVPSHVGR